MKTHLKTLQKRKVALEIAGLSHTYGRFGGVVMTKQYALIVNKITRLLWQGMRLAHK